MKNTKGKILTVVMIIFTTIVFDSCAGSQLSNLNGQIPLCGIIFVGNTLGNKDIPKLLGKAEDGQIVSLLTAASTIIEKPEFSSMVKTGTGGVTLTGLNTIIEELTVAEAAITNISGIIKRIVIHKKDIPETFALLYIRMWYSKGGGEYGVLFYKCPIEKITESNHIEWGDSLKLGELKF